MRGLIDLMVVVFALVPVLWIISLSFKTTSTLTDGRFIPQEWTFDNYRTIFATDQFVRALVNFIGIALIATFIAVLLGMLAAYAISRLTLPPGRCASTGNVSTTRRPRAVTSPWSSSRTRFTRT
ncbi:hypothetical protein [Paractinoplanes aksuensis]|uniref:hypothetical protein n=1 Tax=Paractinoplanes aksuensis TaxID=2939490 RepID=UPI003F693FAD